MLERKLIELQSEKVADFMVKEFPLPAVKLLSVSAIELWPEKSADCITKASVSDLTMHAIKPIELYVEKAEDTMKNANFPD